MTEYNYFCRADDKNKDGYQQAKYRVFNVEVGKEEYEKIRKIYHKLEFDKNENHKTRFQTAFKKMRNQLTKEQQQEYLNIPHFNAEGFKIITGVDVTQAEEMTLEEVCKELGRNIKIVK